jgi:Tfp pilus assembly protein PilO
VQQFIHAVETLPDFVVIDNLTLTEGNDDGALTLNLSVSTYYLARSDVR